MSKTAQPSKGSGSNVQTLPLPDLSGKEKSTDGLSSAAAKSESTKLTRKDKLKQEHLKTVVKQLGVSDCSRLYIELPGLSDADVTRFKKGTDTSVDTDLEARNVLKAWMGKIGDQATRQAVIDALEKCENNLAKGNLEEHWLQDTGPLKEDDISDIIEVGGLGRNDIYNLFEALGLEESFIERKSQVERSNVERQAKAVLLGWIRKKTPAVGDLLTALERADNLNASQDLQDIWKMTENKETETDDKCFPGKGHRL